MFPLVAAMWTPSPFLVSTAVQIRISKGPQSFEAHARITNVKVGLGMGLVFVSASAEQKKVLGDWIAELGGNVSAVSAQTAEDKDKGKLDGELPNVVAALIQALLRKGVLTESEAQEMLRKLRH